MFLVKNSIDFLLRGNSSVSQIRQLSINEKTNIKYKKLQKNSLSLLKTSNNFKNIIQFNPNNWTILNQQNQIKSRNLKTKKLLIYTYSLSNNLVKEAVYKLGLKLLLTKEIKKATIIIGLKKHLKQNFKLKKLAKQRNIPIYMINQSTVYQVTKLLQSLICKNAP